MMDDFSHRKLFQQLGFLRDVIWHLRFTKKYVEDDTCMDRIITALQIALRANENKELVLGFFSTDKAVEILSNCHHVMKHAHNYHDSSSGFATKLFASLSAHDWIVEKICSIGHWNDCIKVYATMLSSAGEISPSLQFSWLSSFIHVTSCKRTLLSVLQNGFTISDVAELTNSSSIFVRRCSHKVFSILITKLIALQQEDTKEDKSKIEDNLKTISHQLKTECSADTTIHVISESLLIDYQPTCAFVEQFMNNGGLYFESPSVRQVLLKQSQAGNQNVVSFFLHLLQASELPEKPCENIVHFNTIHEAGINALINNITSMAGYSIIGALANISEKRKQCVEILMLPYRIAIKDEYEIESGEVFVKWEEVLTRSFESRGKLASVICNSTTIICKLWKSGILLCDEKERGITFFSQSLTAIFELSPNQNSLPQLIQNWKVALSILECLCNSPISIQLSESPKGVNNFSRLRKNLIEILSHSDADQLMVKKCGYLLINFLKSGLNGVELLELICQGISTKLMDRRWKVKDSILEVFYDLLVLFEKDLGSNAQYQSTFKACIADCDIVNLVLLALKDDNSYVRASSLKCVGFLFNNTECFKDNKAKVNLFEMTLNILTKDTEAFARRAAVNTLATCVCYDKHILSQFLSQFVDDSITIENLSDFELIVNQSALTLRDHVFANDLDWEVRRNGVKFLGKIAATLTDQNMIDSSKAPNKEKILSKIETVLKTLSADFDAAVQESADDLLRQLNDASDVTGRRDVMRRRDAFDWEFDSLLEDVLHRLKSENPVVLSHHSNTGDDAIDSGVILDCY